MNKIESYIDSVIPKNIPKSKQQKLKEEIESHIYDRIDFYTEIGYDTDSSINKALADMGEDEEVKSSIRNDFEQIFKMNKFVKGILCIFISVFLLFVGGCAALIIESSDGPLEQNDVCLFEDYYMYRRSNTNSYLYLKNDEPSLNHRIIQGWIYKYAFDENSRVIAMRYFLAYNLKDVSGEVENMLYYRYYGGEIFAIVEDSLKLYDCQKDEFTDFKNDAELSSFCAENNITLGDWYYPGGNDYYPEEVKTLTGEYKLKTTVYDFSSVLKGDEELLFGFISDVKVDGDVISLRLRQTKNMYSPEYLTTNSALSPLSVNPVGKYKGYDIYYDKYIYIYPDRIVEQP
ncbi:MAG: hypothetical protein IJZ57_02485 [Clostridia bacterium]|nr:hypothetical protein [Clostridia bacterium]